MNKRVLVACLLVVAGCAGNPSTAPATAPAAVPTAAGPLFAFHVGFWVNLHQRLYAESGRRPIRDPLRAATSADQAAWDGAVELYRARFAERGLLTLLTNTELADVNHELGVAEDAPDLSGTALAPELRDALESAAKVYRSDAWAADQRADRAFIARIEPTVAEHGAAVSAALSRAYEAPWPTEPVRVEVAPYAGPVGAYTDDRITIAAHDPRHAGDAAFEILFHESSHLLAGPLDDLISEACAARGRAVPPTLWHAILFEMTGEIVRRELGPAYEPYADHNGLWARDETWTSVRPLLRRLVPDHLDGKRALRATIELIIDGLPASS